MLLELKDKRVPKLKGKKYTLDTFKNYQKKTTIEYDYLTREYKIYTNVLAHITKILAIREAKINIITVNKVGNISSLEAILTDKNIQFKSIKNVPKLNNLEKLEAKKRLLKGRGIKLDKELQELQEANAVENYLNSLIKNKY